MANRYCRNCGHELAENDRFCPNCGTPIQEAAHVPTPEADVPVPPPPQGGQEAGERSFMQKWWRLIAFLAVAALFAVIGPFIAPSGGGGDANQNAGNADQDRGQGTGPVSKGAAEPRKTFTTENYPELVSDPDAHEGAKVDVTGQVFTSPEVVDGATGFQMFADPENGEWNTAVLAEGTDLGLQIDDYVRVVGTVTGSIEGENAFGGTITMVGVEASKVAPVNAAQAVDPTEKTVEVGQTLSDQGFSITLRKIKFGEDTTRVYISAHNGTNVVVSFYTYDAKIIQGGRQIEEDMSFAYELPEPQSDIEPGVKTDGAVILGKADPAEPMRVKFEWYSDNFNINAKPIVFEVNP